MIIDNLMHPLGADRALGLPVSPSGFGTESPAPLQLDLSCWGGTDHWTLQLLPYQFRQLTTELISADCGDIYHAVGASC